MKRGEREVLARIAAGKTNEEIAHELELSLRAVEKRRAKAMKDLRIDSKMELLHLLHSAIPMKPRKCLRCGTVLGFIEGQRLLAEARSGTCWSLRRGTGTNTFSSFPQDKMCMQLRKNKYLLENQKVRVFPNFVRNTRTLVTLTRDLGNLHKPTAAKET